MLSPKTTLLLILAFAFLVRVVGIGYGLPLWLIDDEPPFALAALKMFQLKTLLPAFHIDEFRSVLYYPPYLSYFYLPFFAILLVGKYLAFGGDVASFSQYLALDLSSFFLLVRFLNVLIGTFSVYLIYEISKNIFRNEKSAIFSALFLSTSLFHIMMSANGRHWLPVSFFLIFVMWLLSDQNADYRKKYFKALAVTGIGMGVSPISGIALVLIALWYLFMEQRKFSDIFREKYFYSGAVLFILLAILPGVLYPQSFGFSRDVTFGEAKSATGILASPAHFLSPVVMSEPLLIIFAFSGLLYAFFRNKNIFWTFLLFIFSYSAIFYLFFRYEHRFTLPLFPILVLLAAYGLGEFLDFTKGRISMITALIIFGLLAVFSLRIGYLMYHGDSRSHMVEWIKSSIPENSKIIVYARLTRVPSLPDAIREQREIDRGSLRKIDLAEEASGVSPSFHALNLYTVDNEEFYSGLDFYAEKNRYQYVAMSLMDFEKNPSHFDNVYELANNGRLLASFGSLHEDYSPYIGQLRGNPLELFKISEFGPPVAIYKID